MYKKEFSYPNDFMSAYAPNYREPEPLIGETIAVAPKKVRMTHKHKSLFDLAGEQVQRNVHQEVEKDVEALRASGQLNPENVRKNILNQIALLDVREDIAAKVLQAYKRSPRWECLRDERVALDHKDQDWVKCLSGEKNMESLKSEYVVFCNANSDASEVAVIAQSCAWEHGNLYYGTPPEAKDRLLYLWRENRDIQEWSRTLQGIVDQDAEDLVWSSSDQALCIAGRETIAIFMRETVHDDFKQLYIVPVMRFRDERLDVLGMWRGAQDSGLWQSSGNMDELWQSFGRFAWNDAKQELVVETDRRPDARHSQLSIIPLKDGAVEKTQTIEVPISSAWGINAIDWSDEGDLHVVDVASDRYVINNVSISIYTVNAEDGMYVLDERRVLQGRTLWKVLEGEIQAALCENDRPYVVSQVIKNNLRSIAPLSGYLFLVERNRRIYLQHNQTIAVREHEDVGIRAIGYMYDAHSWFDKYAFIVHSKEPRFSSIVQYLSRDPKRERNNFEDEDVD